MSMYSSNFYDLTVPMLSVGPIMEVHKVNTIKDWGGAWPTEWETHTPEGLADMIAREAGADDADGVEATIVGGDVRIIGYSYGKVGSIDELCLVMAECGATGIINGECEGDHFLTELADKAVIQHAGRVVFPTYTGGLYRS